MRQQEQQVEQLLLGGLGLAQWSHLVWPLIVLVPLGLKRLGVDPAVASSYYMRGRAKQAINDPTAADDVARGMRLEPGVAQRYAGYGIAP